MFRIILSVFSIITSLIIENSDWLQVRSLVYDNYLSGFFKMVSSSFVEVIDEEILISSSITSTIIIGDYLKNMHFL